MKPATLLTATLTIALAGCMSAPSGLQVALPPGPGSGPMAQAAPAPGPDGQPASMPFKTLVVDEGPGRWLAAGADERAVLRSRAELDALLARHTPYVPAPAGPMRPIPGASVGPPMMAPPPGAPTPAPPTAEPLPEALTGLDFERWQAIAFVDGAVDLSTSSRITAVVDRGDRLEVQTTRWIAPPNPASGASPSGRLHVVAIPRIEKPIVFAETTELDGTAKAGEGGYGVAGGPIMSPKWKAVPNPELTREAVESVFRGMVGPGATAFSVERRTIAWVRANLLPEASRQRFTLDSEVWVGVAEGDLLTPLPGGRSAPGLEIGAGKPQSSRIIALYSIEDVFPHAYEMVTKAEPVAPGMRIELATNGNFFLGDTLRFTTSGPLVDGELTLTVTPAGGPPLVRKVPFSELAAFGLVLDAAHVPGITGAPVQDLAINYASPAGQGGNSLSRDVKLLRDRDGKPTPPMRIQGPGKAEEYRPAAGESAWDAMARDIATTDWQGKDLQTTSRATRFADVPRKPAYNFVLAPEAPVRVYEFRGTFPKFFVPAVVSGRGVDEVMAPRRLVVAVTEQVPVIVVGLDVYAE